VKVLIKTVIGRFWSKGEHTEELDMGLVKLKLGDLVAPIDERNIDKTINLFYGININKEFMPTVANIDEVIVNNT